MAIVASSCETCTSNQSSEGAFELARTALMTLNVDRSTTPAWAPAAFTDGLVLADDVSARHDDDKLGTAVRRASVPAHRSVARPLTLNGAAFRTCHRISSSRSCVRSGNFFEAKQRHLGHAVGNRQRDTLRPDDSSDRTRASSAALTAFGSGMLGPVRDGTTAPRASGSTACAVTDRLESPAATDGGRDTMSGDLDSHRGGRWRQERLIQRR